MRGNCRREKREGTAGEKKERGLQLAVPSLQCKREKREGTAGEGDVRKGENRAGLEVE